MRKWFQTGLSNCRMARRLGVDETTIRRTLRRLKLARRPTLEEFALDALVEYGAKELPEAAAANEEADRPTMRGFKIAHAGLRERLQQAEAKIQRLLEQRHKTSKRIPASEPKTLKTEKKPIADAIKMAAYQVETELRGMLQHHYARADEEGRTLLPAAFQSPARLEMVEGELRVTIARQSSPHRTAALAPFLLLIATSRTALS